ncbi:MAG: ABC transporter ATP-binding protein [Candidatus Zixiibacteriota bacterium]|nr:MAG: ABC transporter ATP-binding protein [candidate division Zixibacteria bacterium]
MKLYLRLLKFMKPHLKFFLTAIIFGMLFAAMSGVSLTMIVPFTKIIFEQDIDPGAQTESIDYSKLLDLDKETFVQVIGGETRIERLGRFCIGLLIIFLIKNIFLYCWSFLIVRVEQGVIRDIRDTLFTHYHGLPLEYFHSRRAGELISRITNDITLVRGAIANGLSDLIKNLFLAIIFLYLVFAAAWKLALLGMIVMPPSIYIISLLGRRVKVNSAITQEKLASITTVLQETVSGIRVVKAFAMEKFEIGRFRKYTRDFFRTMVRLTRIGSLGIPLTEMLGVAVGVFILWYSGRQILMGTGLTADKFFLFLVAIFSLMQPIKVLSRVNIDIQQGLAAAERIFRVLDTKPKIVESPDPIVLRGFDDSIRFENVNFSYGPEGFALHDINLELKKGQVMALAGPSGGGKSTIVDLIPRFYDPAAGLVTLDGHDLKKVSLESLRNLMGIVTQEIILFNDTIYNNVAYGRSDLGEEAVNRVLEAACARDFVEEMPENIHTMIGDRGVKLSGGQRQRIAIARALLKDPPILIFDEATSSLDTESELLITQAISNLFSGRTVIIIAHRLSTIRKADIIHVVEDGRIVQTGGHADLLKKGGLYKKLHDLQYQDLGI